MNIILLALIALSANMIGISYSAVYANGKTFIIRKQKHKRTSLFDSKFVMMEEEASSPMYSSGSSSSPMTSSSTPAPRTDSRGLNSFSNSLKKKPKRIATRPPVVTRSPSKARPGRGNGNGPGRGHGAGSGNGNGSGTGSGRGTGRGASGKGTGVGPGSGGAGGEVIAHEDIFDDDNWDGFAVEQEIELERSMGVKAVILD